jgi:cytochrome b561
MSGQPNDAAKFTPLALHIGIGLLTLVVIAIRLVARPLLSRPAHAATGSAFLDWLGRAVHGSLYLVVLLMTISGLSLSMQSGLLPIIFGGSGASLPQDFYDFAARARYGFIAPALLIFVVLHVGGALYYQFKLKDKLMSCMWYGERKA